MNEKIRTPQEQVRDMFIKTVKNKNSFSKYHSNSMGIMRGEGSSFYTFSEEKADEVFNDLVNLIKEHF